MTSTTPRPDELSDGLPTESPALTVPPARRSPRPVRDQQRAEVVIRYARLLPSGRPMYCKPSRAEMRGEVSRRQGRGTDGKVIYPDRATAEAAARELEALGSRPMRSYLCRRSSSGHHHLTTDSAAMRSARVPWQRPPAE